MVDLTSGNMRVSMQSNGVLHQTVITSQAGLLSDGQWHTVSLNVSDIVSELIQIHVSINTLPYDYVQCNILYNKSNLIPLVCACIHYSVVE